MSAENQITAVDADSGTIVTVTPEDFAQTVGNITFDDIIEMIVRKTGDCEVTDQRLSKRRFGRNSC